MSSKDLTKSAVLREITKEIEQKHQAPTNNNQIPITFAIADLHGRLPISLATLKRHLSDLVASGQLFRHGKGRATCYSLGHFLAHEQDRARASFQRSFVDRYVPNQSFFLPPKLADTLVTESRRPIPREKIGDLNNPLHDLAWWSSHLAGNSFTREAAVLLLTHGNKNENPDALMLLNHLRAGELLLEYAPQHGIIGPLFRRLNTVLLQDLPPGEGKAGEIRSSGLALKESRYLPCSDNSQLREMFLLVLSRARKIVNPLEAACFLWLNLSYLQPFSAGNQRTSRLAASIPLLINRCPLLSFAGISPSDYQVAMQQLYENQETASAIELFEASYRLTRYSP